MGELNQSTGFELELPWGAWYEDSLHKIKLPGHWSVDVFAPQPSAACSSEEIKQTLEEPLESPSLHELAKGCRTACVVVDDLARPTRASDILEPLLAMLAESGLTEAAVKIVIATGSHGSLNEEQIGWKVGATIARRYRVECHDCQGNLAGTGISYGDRELEINRTFLEADLKIAIGSVLPHSFAGYSGGAKMVLPGLSDRVATARSHKFVQLGLRGGSDPGKNRFRTEIEELTRRLGLKFIVCVLTNSGRETTQVFAGDPVSAHRTACNVARKLFRVETTGEYDCLVLNSYPKDIDLVQAENAFVALKTATSPVVRDGGVYVLTTAASQGIGRHGLFAPGGVSYRSPTKKRSFANRELWIYAPGVSTDDVRKLYWDGYPVFHDCEDLLRKLSERFPKETRAAILTCATMQQIDNTSH